MVVNLMFDTTEARRLGIEGHLCELQLTTRGFADPAAIAQVRVGHFRRMARGVDGMEGKRGP